MAAEQKDNWADRRDSARVSVEMLVRSYDMKNFETCNGDISMGGARIQFHKPPKDMQVEVMFTLGEREIRLQGDILDMRLLESGLTEARVRFLDWDVRDELALARILQEVSGEWDIEKFNKR